MPKKYKTRAQPLETNNAGNTRKSDKKNQENEFTPLLVHPIRKGGTFNPAPSKNKKAGLYSSLPQWAGLSNGVNIKNPLWLAVSEAAKLGGVQTKTIRRAIKSNHLRYKVIGNRYLINLESLIDFSYSNRKLKNKLNEYGLGQYINPAP